MSYYIKPDGRTAVFECGGKTLAGRLRGLEPATLKTASAGYPAYEIISVDGVVDIIEHRKMEPVFYTTDDPVVWKNLGIAPASPPDKSPSPYPP